jgi:hypothetical protein
MFFVGLSAKAGAARNRRVRSEASRVALNRHAGLAAARLIVLTPPDSK